MLKKVLQYFLKGFSYLCNHGVWEFTKKVFRKLSGKERPVNYQKWLKKHLPDKNELESQCRQEFSYSPKISIVVPLHCTPENYLNDMIQSVCCQTYGKWELILSDGSGENTPLKTVLEHWEKEDSRIHVLYHKEQLSISENTNCGIVQADGEFVAFLDHADRLTEHALYEYVKLLNENPKLDLIYSDEDKMTLNGKKFFQPHFKPDFNPDLLRTVNYICHFVIVRSTLIQKVGMMDANYEGAQEYDFLLRCIDQTDQIGHIPKILYHWRSHKESTAENLKNRQRVFEAGKRAINAHYKRNHIPATADYGEYPGLYRTGYLWKEQPLVSILIPNKDHVNDLKRCIESIESKTTYRNYEYIIIENNSTDEETFQFYKELEAHNPKVRVVYWDGMFNYSAINNFGARYANGEYFLLLNNDTEMINESCIEELLGYCMRNDVGAVGARLYYEDDTIQHAGVVIGFGGIAGHCFVQHSRKETGYCHRIVCAQNYSAVTAACMMVKRRAFELVGGLSVELAVAFNDIDLCMKLREAGYLIVYNPYAELYHYESKSRGLEDTPEKVARFNKEIDTFARRWPKILKEGDPFYNQNLALDRQDFALKKVK